METETKRKNPKALRLSDDGEGLLLDLAHKLGLKQTGVIELALRRLAHAEGLPIPGIRTGTQNGTPAGESSEASAPSAGA